MQSPPVGRVGAVATAVTFFAGLVLSGGLTGCSSDPADVAGAFSISLTNRENGCALTNWTVGAQSQGVPVTITQNGATASADVGGVGRIALDLLLGNHVYQGDVDGSDIALKILGSRAGLQGTCAYTLNSQIDATLAGDALAGTIKYTAATNGNADCGTLTGCVSTQDFNGTRPPR
ncbi:MAG: hypothetical protein KBG15_05235 [Kofleriaceae bacterium]|nr:hypothetical protein [Kofleriaceae bacterium]